MIYYDNMYRILIDDKRILIKENDIIKYFYHQDEFYNIGDICIGCIVQKNDYLNSFFVSFGDVKNGFLPYKNVYRQDYKIGDYIFVQIKKEMRDNKGAYLTNLISISSKYFVYIPYSKVPGFHSSKKLNNTESNRISLIAQQFLNKTNAIIARTESHNIDNNILIDDLDKLVNRWENIEKNKQNKQYKVEETQHIFKILYNHLTQNTIIYVQNSKIRDNIKPYIKEYPVYINEQMNIDNEINNILQSRIILQSGAMISIDVTEAIIAIDVNSFKSTHSVKQINLEAAEEIIRQIILKNLSGLIVIDFISDICHIDLLAYIKNLFKKDKVNTEVSFLDKMYLCVISRERIGRNIWDITGMKCPACHGHGILPNNDVYYNFHINDNLLYMPYIRAQYLLDKGIKKYKRCKYDIYNIFTNPIKSTKKELKKLILYDIAL